MTSALHVVCRRRTERLPDAGTWRGCEYRGRRDIEPLHGSASVAILQDVRNLVFHRWAMALLLVSRLVLGEFAHAMPSSHAPVEAEVAAASSQNADCPQHKAASHGTGSQSSDIASAADEHHNCCISGACQCPCMHVPAAAVASFTPTSLHANHERIMNFANGFACDRLWSLFRPPA